LKGKVTTSEGDTAISEGKISGDDISFVVKRRIDGKQIILLYKGRVAGRVYGDAIEFTCKVQGGIEQPYEFIAKREFPLGDYDLRLKGLIAPIDPENKSISK